ncbi:hypothetical protein H4Q26_009694 [Puccinia striiformis f. sp. tritici PST-130]|nr:hypothetical protein H4Q26_009694 [Puccinia striiformis f. sp. tritici PST-130]
MYPKCYDSNLPRGYHCTTGSLPWSRTSQSIALMMSSQQRATNDFSSYLRERVIKADNDSDTNSINSHFSLRSAEQQLPKTFAPNPASRSHDSTLEFEKHRNVSVNTIENSSRPHHRYRSSSDHQHKSEKAFYSARMAAAAPVVRKSMAVEVVKERHVLRLKDDEPRDWCVVEEAGESTDDATQAIFRRRPAAPATRSQPEQAKMKNQSQEQAQRKSALVPANQSMDLD